MAAVHQILDFKTEGAKERWLDGAASIDATAPLVSAMCHRLLRAHSDPGAFATAVHRFVRDSIAYQRDPMRADGTREQFADASTVLQRGWDDCDGKARLVVALCRCAANLGLAIEARIRGVWKGGHFRHAQAEIRWPGSELKRCAEPGGWILSDTIVAGLPLGGDPETKRNPTTGKIPTR